MRLSANPAQIVLLLSTLAVPLAGPAGATTLIRQGLEGLTAENEAAVRGRVLDVHSYWNAEKSFILTDVRLRVDEVLKGDRSQREVTITVMGGKVGDVTTLIIGGPDLVAGSDYVLFLKHEDLPGAAQRLTVRDLVQGTFDVSNGRAVSQAVGHGLLPDASGRTGPPGGEEGLTLEEMSRQVRQLAGGR